MAKKEKQTDDVEIEFNFPAEGVTIMASNQDEALEKLKEMKALQKQK